MTIDYAKPTQVKDRLRWLPPPVRWLIVGLLLGFFISGLLFIKLSQPPVPIADKKSHRRVIHAHVPPSHTIIPQSDIKKVIHPKNVAPKPEFDFYTMLPNMKVKVAPQEETSHKTQAAKTSSLNQDQQYWVQLGIFKDYRTADRLKAKLALDGISVIIARIKGSGHVWHRVQRGPFARQQAKRDQRWLAKKQLSSKLLKSTG